MKNSTNIFTFFKKSNYYLFAIIFIFINIYFCRWIISYKFEPKYWENFYYESQWNIPNSKRVIGDDGVYRYIGYRLVNGENPFNVDYWVPPLGKYLYGLGAKYLSNPLFISILFYLLLILVFISLSQELLNKNLILLSLILFLFNPFVVSEIRTTMLDLPLTLMLTTSLLFFIKYIKYNHNINYYLSIFFLGLSVGTKPPFFVFAYVLIYGLFLLKKHQFKKIIILPFLVLSGYITAYVPSYFIHHPNPIPWIRLHQKVYEFQKNNLNSHNWFSIITYLLYGRFMGYWVNAKALYPSDFNLVFTFGSLSVFWVMFKNFISKKHNDVFIVFCSIGAVYILMLFLVDFWPRYLMPLIPMFSIIIPYLFQKKFISVPIYLILFISLYTSYKNTIIFPSKVKFEEEFYGYQQSNRLKEMYQMLSTQSKIQINEENFLKYKPIKFSSINENNQWRMNLIK
jgi:hypothetical protein